MTRSTKTADATTAGTTTGSAPRRRTRPTAGASTGKRSVAPGRAPVPAGADPATEPAPGMLPEGLLAAAGLGDDDTDFNLVVLGGRLSTDAEYHTYESGATAMRFLVTLRLEEPRRRVDVVPVTMWSPPRHLVRKPPKRDERYWFTGNVQRRFFEGPDGRRSRLEVVAHSVQRDSRQGKTGGAKTS